MIESTQDSLMNGWWNILLSRSGTYSCRDKWGPSLTINVSMAGHFTLAYRGSNRQVPLVWSIESIWIYTYKSAFVWYNRKKHFRGPFFKTNLCMRYYASYTLGKWAASWTMLTPFGQYSLGDSPTAKILARTSIGIQSYRAKTPW